MRFIHNMYIQWLDDKKGLTEEKAGNKAVNLNRLTQFKFNVPCGFCITGNGFDDFLQKNKIEMNRFAEQIRDQNDELGKAFCELPLPEDMENEIVAAIERLGKRKSGSLNLAVRSSVWGEDSDEESFAGLYDTFLNIRTVRDVLLHVKRCWLSLLSKRSRAYKSYQQYEKEIPGMGVIVQEMLDSPKSGVLFTINPVTGNRNEIIIEAKEGLCIDIVSGSVNPDLYKICKYSSFDKQQDQWEKSIQKNGCLKSNELRALLKTALKAEEKFGYPLDIEWGLYNNKIYILQNRPISAICDSVQSIDRDKWTDQKINERFPEPLKPLDGSHERDWFFEPSFRYMLKYFRTRISKKEHVCQTFNGKLYLNKSVLKRIVNNRPDIFDNFISNSPHPIRPGDFPLFFLIRILLGFLMTEKKIERTHKRFNKKIKAIQEKKYNLINWEYLYKEMKILQKEYLMVSAKHMLSILLAEIAYILLDKLSVEFFGKEGHRYSRQLLAGQWNRTVQMNEDFRELCVYLENSEKLKSLFLAENAEDLSQKWQTIKDTGFLSRFTAFLDKYGHRSEKYDISSVKWKEDPLFILKKIKNNLSQEKTGHKFIKKENPQMEREIKKRLTQNGVKKLNPLKYGFFWGLIKLGRTYGNYLREEEGYHIIRLHPIIKDFYLAVAEKLFLAGKLAQTEDVFFLEVEEIEALLTKEIEICPDLKHLVDKRKSQFHFNLQLYVNQNNRNYTDSHALKGIPVCTGVYTGAARVIATPEEEINEGEIIITHTLNSSWTIIFNKIGGIVTELGGMLSHGSILAREFGIPTIVNVKNATRLIQTGRIIRINGNDGIITKLE